MKYCPICGKQTLEKIETCHDNEEEIKCSYSCSCPICEFNHPAITYIVFFKGDN